MNKNNLLFWNVDTQYDFVMPDGKLYVSGAELLRPLWKEITAFATQKNIKVVNSADYHNEKTVEISNQPDFIHTFPPHCMQNTVGAEFVAETLPANPLVIDWNKKYNIVELMRKPNLNKNIVIRKDKFDVFAGNPYTDEVVSALNPETVVVYGVTTNVCVDQAVQGLAKRVKNVIVKCYCFVRCYKRTY